jgi:hypothetical protein
MTGVWDLYSIAGVLRFSRNSKMDKIECFVAGRKIASGLRWKDSVIHAHGDDFACASDMFRVHLNKISPPGEFQLRRIRAHGVSNPPQCLSVK